MLPLVCRLNGLDNCSGYAEKPAATDSATNSFLDGPRPHRRRRHPAWRSYRHAGVLSALAEERGRVYQIGRDKAALPRGPRRGRPTARLRSRSEAEPSERDREAGSRGRKNRSRIRGESERAPRGGWDRDDDEAEAGVAPRGRGGARDRRHAVCASDPGFGNSFSRADTAVRRRSAGACAPPIPDRLPDSVVFACIGRKGGVELRAIGKRLFPISHTIDLTRTKGKA